MSPLSPTWSSRNRPMRLHSLVLLLLAGGSLAAADGDAPLRDRVTFRNAPPIEAAEVISEGSEEIVYKLTPEGNPSRKPARNVIGVEYVGMKQVGDWKSATEALTAGQFTTAAASYAKVAAGPREWEKVYGAIAQGDALEQAGKYAEAAKSFNVVVAKYKDHRLWLDAAYREGMALAMAKDATGAEAVAAKLSDQAKGKIGPPAESRAAAIRTAVLYGKGDLTKVIEQARRVNLRPQSEPDAWFHFNFWLADAYRKGQKPKEAARIAETMLASLDEYPVRKAQAIALKGLSLVESDPQAALIELLKLDVLPFGSETQKCEARYQAGVILNAEAGRLAAAPDTAKDEVKKAFVKELNVTSRLVLTAAAASPVACPAKDKAAELVKKLPPE